jgi:cobalamin biosynthesis protein CobD/CbiB
LNPDGDRALCDDCSPPPPRLRGVSVLSRWWPLAAVALAAGLALGGEALYEQGVEAGREKEREQLRTTCGLAHSSADNLIEAATICIEAIRY